MFDKMSVHTEKSAIGRLVSCSRHKDGDKVQSKTPDLLKAV